MFRSHNPGAFVRHACPTSSSQAASWPRHSVMLSEETFVMRKGLLTLPVAQPRQNDEAILKTHELLICGNVPYTAD